jgi:hypothetical protein
LKKFSARRPPAAPPQEPDAPNRMNQPAPTISLNLSSAIEISQHPILTT